MHRALVTRILGRQRRQFEDNIKMGLMQICFGDVNCVGFGSVFELCCQIGCRGTKLCALCFVPILVVQLPKMRMAGPL